MSLEASPMTASLRAQQLALDPLTNRLLAALPGEEYAQLRPHLEIVEMPTGRTIYEPGEVPRHVYFLLTGCASVVVSMADGAMVEAGTDGRGGIGGLSAFRGPDAGPLTTIGQVPGVYARLPVTIFRDVAAPGGALHTL